MINYTRPHTHTRIQLRLCLQLLAEGQTYALEVVATTECELLGQLDTAGTNAVLVADAGRLLAAKPGVELEAPTGDVRWTTDGRGDPLGDASSPVSFPLECPLPPLSDDTPSDMQDSGEEPWLVWSVPPYTLEVVTISVMPDFVEHVHGKSTGRGSNDDRGCKS